VSLADALVLLKSRGAAAAAGTVKLENRTFISV